MVEEEGTPPFSVGEKAREVMGLSRVWGGARGLLTRLAPALPSFLPTRPTVPV